MERWREALNGDPLPWLLEPDTPAVRHLALRDLLDEPEDSAPMRRARAAAMRGEPIARILDHQAPAGWWERPGAGYGPKYRSTVWSLMFLEQMGADGRDRRIARACEYVLAHTQTSNGGLGISGSTSERPPPPSAVVHCLNGNLLRALLRFGRLGDPRVRLAVEWQARSITGEGFDGFYRSGTSGPGFACAINDGLPCGWGAIKGLRALAAIPRRRRTAQVRRAVDVGLEFLLSRDPAIADYPTGTTVSPNWFKLGFPSGYVADVLQNLEVLAELGSGRDPRLSNALELVLGKQDDRGRWWNEYGYRGKMWVDVDPPRRPSKWVTLRACRVLKAVLG
ncbi:MAG TPA: nitrogen fixation protein NifH [Actinomycetota bacterium]|nr:nitrogen fixation protein NifH [Actinomycetota bacterium]